MRFALQLLSYFCLVAVVSTPLRSHGDEESDDFAVKVMSFNIRNGKAKDGENAWPKRKSSVATAIIEYEPDILGTQEAYPFQVEFLEDQLFDYHVYSHPRTPGGEACAIFFHKDVFELVDKGTFWLSETPDKPGSKSWDSSLPRIVSWVVLKHVLTERELLFANTHFDHRGRIAREKSAELSIARLPELAKGKPIIFTGDFNTPEGTTPHLTLTEKKDGAFSLTDTFVAAHPTREPGKDATFSGFSPRGHGARIDWVLCSNELQVTAAAVDKNKYEERIPSDHFPVTATIKVPAKSAR